MRDIKFRVWNPAQKRFFRSYQDRGLAFKFGTDEEMEQSGCYDLEQCIIFGWPVQQFTGFYDKNGNQIYEGDILKYSPDYIESQGGQAGPAINVIEFNYGCFFLGKYPLMDFIENESQAFQDKVKIDFEVIGNIFENPELLK